MRSASKSRRLVTNTSSTDSPNLALDSIVDTVLGDLSEEAPDPCDNPAPGASCQFDVPWTVAAVDEDGQVNATVELSTITRRPQ